MHYINVTIAKQTQVQAVVSTMRMVFKWSRKFTLSSLQNAEATSVVFHTFLLTLIAHIYSYRITSDVTENGMG